jgi:hypothetical protein
MRLAMSSPLPDELGDLLAGVFDGYPGKLLAKAMSREIGYQAMILVEQLGLLLPHPATNDQPMKEDNCWRAGRSGFKDMHSPNDSSTCIDFLVMKLSRPTDGAQRPGGWGMEVMPTRARCSLEAHGTPRRKPGPLQRVLDVCGSRFAAQLIAQMNYRNR